MPQNQTEEDKMTREAKESIEDVVKSIVVAELRVDRDQLGADTHLMKDLGADSLDALNIALRLEEQFKIKIPDDAIPKFLTIGDIVKGVNDHLSTQ
jgi:acyl carrier protein